MPSNVLITGASSGIGRATTEIFAREGWNVVATVRDRARSKGLFEKHANVELLKLDVTDDKQAKAAVTRALNSERLGGRLDVLINNAGALLFGALETTSVDEAKHLFDVNYFGAMRLIQAILPHMRKRHSGTILNVSSVVSEIGVPMLSVYGSTKAALSLLGESLSIELAGTGVRVKTVHPGLVGTDLYEKFSSSFDKSDSHYGRIARHYVAALRNPAMGVLSSEDAGRALYQIATTPGEQLDYYLGTDARTLMLAKRLSGKKGLQKQTSRIFSQGVQPSGAMKMLARLMGARHAASVNIRTLAGEVGPAPGESMMGLKPPATPGPGRALGSALGGGVPKDFQDLKSGIKAEESLVGPAGLRASGGEAVRGSSDTKPARLESKKKDAKTARKKEPTAARKTPASRGPSKKKPASAAIGGRKTGATRKTGARVSKATVPPALTTLPGVEPGWEGGLGGFESASAALVGTTPAKSPTRKKASASGTGKSATKKPGAKKTGAKKPAAKKAGTKGPGTKGLRAKKSAT